MPDKNFEDELNKEFKKRQQEARDKAAKEGKREVTQDDYKRSIQLKLLELYTNWESLYGAFSRGRPSTYNFTSFESIDTKYSKALEALKEFPRQITQEDINLFCAYPGVAKLDRRGIGLFLSALLNSIPEKENSTLLEIGNAKLANYFGFSLSRKVSLKGDLGDETALKMASGRLGIDGNCNGVVGMYMGDPEIRNMPQISVYGSVQDFGSVRYSGTVHAATNHRSYFNFTSMYDVIICLRQEPFRLFISQAEQAGQGAIVDITQKFQTMLHPKLVEICCDYNIGISNREIERRVKELEVLIGQPDKIKKGESYDNIRSKVKSDDAMPMTIALMASVFGIHFPPLWAGSLPAIYLLERKENKKIAQLISERDERIRAILGQIDSHKDEMEKFQALRYKMTSIKDRLKYK
ncbi:hypothetical protein HYS31_00305 [Candidatus Woesearchaeota archaeon]|nr:hypothetical protein [Candidatus Woesearchaeota archaeon]